MERFLWIICICLLSLAEGRIKRCYVCQSRGDKGDCRDPFLHNSTTVEKLKAVEDAPCASGWCGKVVKGTSLEVDTMTERLCLQRPPSDAEERCAETLYDNRQVFMCFCQGDLCNRSDLRASPSAPLMLSMILSILLMYKALA